MGTEHPVDTITTHLMAFRSSWTEDIRKRRGGAPNPINGVRGGAGKIVIGNDVWLGQDVTIKSGTEISDGAVIAAGAVVTKNVPAYAIVGGVPARVIRYRFNETTRQHAQSLKWWNFAPEAFQGLPMGEPEKFLEKLEKRIGEGTAKEFKPKKVDLAAEIKKLIS